MCTEGAACTAEGGVSPTKQEGSLTKQGGSPHKQGTSPPKKGDARGSLFGSGGDKGSGAQGASGGGASSWLPTWAGGAKKPEEKVMSVTTKGYTYAYKCREGTVVQLVGAKGLTHTCVGADVTARACAVILSGGVVRFPASTTGLEMGQSVLEGGGGGIVYGLLALW